MGADHSNTKTIKIVQGTVSCKSTAASLRREFAESKLAGAYSGSFNHKNAFEMSWNDETESCFDSVQDCSTIEPCKIEDDDLECEVSFTNDDSTCSESDDCASSQQSTSMLSTRFQPVFA